MILLYNLYLNSNLLGSIPWKEQTACMVPVLTVTAPKTLGKTSDPKPKNSTITSPPNKDRLNSKNWESIIFIPKMIKPIQIHSLSPPNLLALSVRLHCSTHSLKDIQIPMGMLNRQWSKTSLTKETSKTHQHSYTGNLPIRLFAPLK